MISAQPCLVAKSFLWYVGVHVPGILLVATIKLCLLVGDDLLLHGHEYMARVDDDLLLHGHGYMAWVDDDLYLHGQQFMAMVEIDKIR